MKTRHRGLIAVLSMVAMAAGFDLAWGQSAPQRTTPPSRQSFRDRYSILSEQNMFMRDRRRRRDTSSEERRTYQPPPRREEELIALRGVVFEEGEFRAYMENLNNYSLIRLNVGDKIAQGRISQIALDAVEYEQNGRYIWIEVGRNLTGQAAEVASSSTSLPSSSDASPSASGATSQPSGAPIDPNDPNLTIEQKMRLRRQKELGGGK